jgi:hypothetical protein
LIQEYFDEEVVKILYNGKWEIGTVNTTNICVTFIDIIAATCRLKLSSCDFVNEYQFNSRHPDMLLMTIKIYKYGQNTTN